MTNEEAEDRIKSLEDQVAFLVDFVTECEYFYPGNDVWVYHEKDLN
jgi:hypothetical protein